MDFCIAPVTRWSRSTRDTARGYPADQVSLNKGGMLDQLFPPFAGGKRGPRQGFMASF